MKNFLLGLLTALVLILCTGAVRGYDPYGPYKMRLVRNSDGRLLLIDVEKAKATHVTMTSRYVPPEIDGVILDEAGWSEFQDK
ncbi:MAG: hypothetical protein JW806_04405 [Sedimentisphaerales bacterium]|nr:hypothetical protein [Sedimentisphaerales bacterium]